MVYTKNITEKEFIRDEEGRVIKETVAVYTDFTGDDEGTDFSESDYSELEPVCMEGELKPKVTDYVSCAASVTAAICLLVKLLKK